MSGIRVYIFVCLIVFTNYGINVVMLIACMLHSSHRQGYKENN